MDLRDSNLNSSGLGLRIVGNPESLGISFHDKAVKDGETV